MTGNPELQVWKFPERERIFVQTCSATEGYGTRCSRSHCAGRRSTISVAHQCCWNAAQSDTERVDELMVMAGRLRPLPAKFPQKASEREMLFRPHLVLLARDRVRNRVTDLSGLLARVSKLPQELVDMIMLHLNGTVVGSALKAQRTVLEVIPVTAQCVPARVNGHGTTRLWALNFSFNSRHLYAQTRHILGETYLSALSFEKLGSAMSIPFSNQGMRGLQYAMSRFGLRALRILYADKSSTPWLGDSTDCWLGILPTPNLSELQSLSDVSLLPDVFTASLHADKASFCRNYA